MEMNVSLHTLSLYWLTEPQRRPTIESVENELVGTMGRIRSNNRGVIVRAGLTVVLVHAELRGVESRSVVGDMKAMV